MTLVGFDFDEECPFSPPPPLFELFVFRPFPFEDENPLPLAAEAEEDDRPIQVCAVG